MRKGWLILSSTYAYAFALSPLKPKQSQSCAFVPSPNSPPCLRQSNSASSIAEVFGNRATNPSRKVAQGTFAPSLRISSRSRRQAETAVPNGRSGRVPRRAKQRGEEDAERKAFYNDDAFGLVFLTTLLVVRDVSFAAAFALLSGAAAAAVSAGNARFDPLQPGSIAFASLALGRIGPFSAAVRILVSDKLGGGAFFAPADEKGVMIETTLCAISLLWGLFQRRRRM